MIIDLIAGARPNFMKIAPIVHAILKVQSQGKNIQFRLIHTGQHYDNNMSGSFFEELDLPYPNVNLGAGGGTQAEQTAAIMIGYEKVLIEQKSDLCLVVGDVTSTMACAIVAKKMQVKVAHVEGGIRSGDWTMPEEINRIVTDSISNYFFTTSETANSNLKRAGIENNRIYFVGNTMIDTLLRNKDRFRKPVLWNKLSLRDHGFLVLTLHRPANVDDEEKLKTLLSEITNKSNGMPIIFPVHPRTVKVINRLEIRYPQLYLTEPLSYLEFNYLVARAMAVITDSGGITEETTVLGIPCMTLRDNTERPETVSLGTNEMVGTDPAAIGKYMGKLFSGNWKKGTIPDLWDGYTAERIVETIIRIYFQIE